MAQFIAFDPNVEVLGHAVIANTIGVDGDVARLMAAHGLEMIIPTEWYPQQWLLNAMRDIANQKYNVTQNLVGMGIRVPTTAALPPDINSIPSAMMMLDVAYHMNHRNGEIGEYRAEVVGEKRIRMVCRNPYPSDFDYGLIYGFARRFRPANGSFVVTVDEQAPSRKRGDESCTYDVTWD
jgi:hypothetical protein